MTGAELVAHKGAANGYAGLDASGRVPAAQLPAATGEIVWLPGTQLSAGTIALIGALLSRTAYANLWAYAQASGNMAASDAAWTSGQFSPGTDGTNFRVPDGRGVFIRGWDGARGLDAGRAFGSYQADKIASHVHGLNTNMLIGSRASSGLNTGLAPGTSYTKVGQLDDSGANTNTSSTGAAETAPKNVAWLMCIRY